MIVELDNSPLDIVTCFEWFRIMSNNCVYVLHCFQMNCV